MFISHGDFSKQLKLTMQDKHLCWPPYFFLGSAVAPHFLSLESPLRACLFFASKVTQITYHAHCVDLHSKVHICSLLYFTDP